MGYDDQNDEGIEGLLKNFKDWLKDSSNIAGLTVMAGSLALSRYVIAVKLDEAVRASGYSVDLAQQGELMGLFGALGIGMAAFGVGKYAYKAFESGSQKVRAAIVFGTAATLLIVPVFFGMNASGAEDYKEAAYIRDQDSYVRGRLEDCNYFVDGRKIGVKQTDTSGEIIGNPNFLNPTTQVVLYGDPIDETKRYEVFKGQIGALLAECEAMQTRGDIRILPPSYRP